MTDKSQSASLYYVVTPGPGPQPGSSLWVGGAGNVTLTPPPTPENPTPAPVQFLAVPAGTRLPVAFSAVTAASATGLVALVF